MTDEKCVCEGNWRKLVAKYSPLIEDVFEDDDGQRWLFLGLLHGEDDYYYVMTRLYGPEMIRLLSCVGDLDSHGYTPIKRDAARATDGLEDT